MLVISDFFTQIDYLLIIKSRVHIGQTSRISFYEVIPLAGQRSLICQLKLYFMRAMTHQPAFGREKCQAVEQKEYGDS
ncbi:Unknown protein sequence [Pseudomonas amygdali pv. sesami]|nr:Unknown protein sequence [Pseudomonas amygdali pv. sesami]